MKTSLIAALGLTTFGLAAIPAQAATPEEQLGMMPKAADVTLLNEGGKYVVIDLKHIAKGGACHMDKDAIVMRVGDGAAKDTTRVRTIMPQTKSGGCPFMTEFEISNADYTAAKKSFTDQKAEADKELADIKKKVGDAWGGLFGSKPEPKGQQSI